MADAFIQRGDSIIPRARNTDALTSHEAAARAKAFALDHRAAILGVLWRPMIAPEIAKLAGLTMEQVCRRLPELQEAGKAKPSGRVRVGPNGTNCREWEKIDA